MFYCFQVKANWSKTIITANHGTHGVLHPPIEKVPLATSQRLHELTHRVPCRRTHALRLLPIDGNPLLSLPDIAGMLYRVLVFRHQVLIDGLAQGCDSYLFHHCCRICLKCNFRAAKIALFFHFIVHNSSFICIFAAKRLNIELL